MSAQFSPDVVDYLRNEKKYDAETIQRYVQTFEAWRERVVGIPTPECATVSDIIAFHARNTIADGQTWEEFKALAIAEHQLNEDQNDIFQPIWHGKTDDRLPPWVTDTAGQVAGGVTPTVAKLIKEDMAAIIRRSSPYLHSITQRRLASPTSNSDAMTDVLTAMCKALPMFVWQLGTGDNATWRWGPAITMLAGLGLNSLRYIAEHMKTNEGWGHLLSLDDEELTGEVVACRNVSGYPAGLLRCDFVDVHHCIARQDHCPRWYRVLVALHIFKYCRVIYNVDDSFHAVTVAYKGRHGIVPYYKSNHEQPLTATANKLFTSTIKTLLRIPTNPPRQRTVFDEAVDSVMSEITPAMLVPRRGLRARPELIVPKGVMYIQDPDLTRGYQFINTGMAIMNCAKIDVHTGVVDRHAAVSGEDVLTYDWPRDTIDPAELEQWRFNLPDKVLPMRASEVILTMLRNVNDLGEPKALRALIDSVLTIGLFRDQVAGTAVGAAIRNEFPLVFAYPMGSTREATTNQGKTNLCRILVRVLVPDFPAERGMNRSDSAPVQRTLAYDIGKYGTALYDEFALPYSSSHFLSKESLQALSTSGIGSPGAALENSPGVRLKYPLFFTSKVSALPPDIRNRQLALFLDQITDANRLPDDMLSLITSGRLSMLARLSHLMYMHKTGMLDRIRDAQPMGGTWRFSAHMTVAEMFAEGDTACLKRYLARAEEQCDKQRGEADLTGLSDELGVNAQFSLVYYWDNAQEMTLDSLATQTAMMEKSCGGMALLDAVKYLVEDGNRRSFDAIMRQHHMREPAMIAVAQKELQQCVFERHGWRMEIVGDSDTKLRDRYGAKRKQCRVLRVAVETPTPAPAKAEATTVK